MKSLGQIAYEAYEESVRDQLKGMGVESTHAPTWDELADWLKEGWEAGVSAALEQYSIRENDE